MKAFVVKKVIIILTVAEILCAKVEACSRAGDSNRSEGNVEVWRQLDLVQDFVFTFVKYTSLKEYSIATALKSSFSYEQISSIYAFIVCLFFYLRNS